MLLSLCPVGCLSSAFLNWDSQQGRDLATSGGNKQKIKFCQSYSYIIRKVWYHQIWIQNNLGFMVLILLYNPWTTAQQWFMTSYIVLFSSIWDIALGSLAFFDLCNPLISKNCITSVELGTTLTCGRNSIQNRRVTMRIFLSEPTGTSVYTYITFNAITS